MLITRSRVVALCLIAMTLGSCSYGYDVKAVAQNGSLVFTIESSGLFGRRTPHVNYVLVDKIGKPTRLVWKLEMREASGPEMHELRYGEVPAKMKATLGPKPLAVGQLYRVTFLTIDGGGGDQFVISDNGEVLNIPR